MKLLYFTDTHIRGSNPKNRKDDFISSLENKFKEIISITEKEDIDYVLHGGDLFDRPDVAISVVSRFANILTEFKVPIYTISGNHDIYGHNPKTLNRSMLGFLNSIGILKVIEEDEKVILEESGLRVQLTGQPYTYDIDDHNEGKYILEDRGSDIDYAIHMVHGMLLDKPFIEGIPYTLIENIRDTRADITLSGHYHLGYKTVEDKGRYFINPGSTVRLTNSNTEMKRRPKVVIISLTDSIDIEEVYLKTAPLGEEVLDRNQVEMNLYKEEQIYEFKQSIEASVNFNKLDVNEILIDIASAEGVAEDVKLEALNRIGNAQIKKAGGNLEVY